MLVEIKSWSDIKKGDILMVKTIAQLIAEGWEPIAWGYIKHRANTIAFAHYEVNYYTGMEKDLTEERLITVIQVDHGQIHCTETVYHVPKESILGVVREVA